MDIGNRSVPGKSPFRAPYAGVAEDLLIEVDRIAPKSLGFKEARIRGRKVVQAVNAVIPGSGDRPMGDGFNLVYQDALGRLTLTPRGDAVGAIVRGGFGGKPCQVGLFEVTSAPSH